MLGSTEELNRKHVNVCKQVESPTLCWQNCISFKCHPQAMVPWFLFISTVCKIEHLTTFERLLNSIGF